MQCDECIRLHAELQKTQLQKSEAEARFERLANDFAKLTEERDVLKIWGERADAAAIEAIKEVQEKDRLISETMEWLKKEQAAATDALSRAHESDVQGRFHGRRFALMQVMEKLAGNRDLTHTERPKCGSCGIDAKDHDEDTCRAERTPTERPKGPCNCYAIEGRAHLTDCPQYVKRVGPSCFVCGAEAAGKIGAEPRCERHV